MSMVGDGESQPTEGVSSIDDIAEALAGDLNAPVESDSEESEETEEVEAEEEEAAEEEEDEGEEPKFTIKVDGKDVELTKTELIERAQKGTDYTQKTMAVAEERKAAEQERAKAAEYRQQLEQGQAETLRRLEAFTKYMETQVGTRPDATMLDYDTAGYLRQKEQYEARRGQLQQAYAARQQIEQEQARQRQAWINEQAATTEKILKDTLPGWNDDTLHALADYAGKLGLTPQTAEAALLTPGFWQLAHKAQAYDAIQAKKATLKPTEKLTKVVKPQASNPTGKVAERAKREAAFNKNPSVDALADLLR
jgi:hypothetical protein